MSIFPGPQPTYTNPPIEPQYFKPRVFQISAISEGPTTTVTTSVNHNYVIGQEIRLLISQPYGARQLNNKTGFVLSIPAANQVVLSINSTLTNAFIASPTFPGNSPPQIVAIGDVNTGVINASIIATPAPTIPGSFQNTSPIAT